MDENFLVIDSVSKSFGSVKALDNISFGVKKGEFITLLGASGCGKTTLLRIIAGLEAADSGRILLDGADISNAEPNKRPLNMVFQNYALFPHMNVEENVGYALKLRRVEKKKRREMVEKALDLVRLSGYGGRTPDELSGGQKQRVAIARAVINAPRALLLDEPLGALDLSLRRKMQTELKKIQESLKIAFIYITHDQEEALNMSDRIILMREGKIIQSGSPSGIYERPDSAYAARFVGEANVISGIAIERSEKRAAISFGDAVLPVSIGYAGFKKGDVVRVAVRRENILFGEDAGIEAVVSSKMFIGGQTRITFEPKSGGEQIVSVTHGINPPINRGDSTNISWKEEDALTVR